jgi:hypothetical protein
MNTMPKMIPVRTMMSAQRDERPNRNVWPPTERFFFRMGTRSLI